MNLSKAVKAVRVLNLTAAGVTTINSASVDMQGFDAVQFIVLFGAIVATGTNKVKAQQSGDDGSADAWADLKGTGIDLADDDDDKIVVLDISKPLERHVRCTVVRGVADTTIDGIIAILYKANVEPITDDASVAGSEHHHAPVEGTA
ncbi:MAG: hypothetical protein IID45_15455 [Planctomycetes bacterium]|nr:hypothetical protein [Planctomycetota bacterium]